MTTESRSKAASPRPRGGLAIAGLLGFGALSVLLVLATDLARNRLVLQNLERLETIADIQTAIANAHLWLEEAVSGDDREIEQALKRLDSSGDLVRVVVAGGQLSSTSRLLPLAQDELRPVGEVLRDLLTEFVQLSHFRYEAFLRGEAVGIGSEVDLQYDALYNRLADQAETLAAALQLRLRQDQHRFRLFFVGLLSAWVALILLTALALQSLQTHRRKAEEALHHSEQRMVQLQKMEAVGRLAGGIAHDINNYLAAITGHCELVRMKAEPGSRVAEKMDSVIATCFRASDLIKRLLAFSRRQPSQPRTIEPNRVIEGMEKMLRQLIGEDIELVSHLLPNLWPVRLDPAQLEQIVVNLLVNARDAMPTGGRIIIETMNAVLDAEQSGRDGLAGEVVVLMVSDTGCGIAEGIRDKIFDPFFTTKAESGSSGLGLATVYAVVEQAGGRIWVYSEEGQGTSFKIYLPRSLDAATAAAAARPAPRVGGSEHLLVVEDNADFRRSTGELLAALGYHVSVASSGAEALAVFAAAERPVQMLITDVVMPGMSGRELVDRLLADQPGLRVLFVSGYTDNVVLRHGIQAGEVAFLQKPFSSDQLATKIRDVLDAAA